MLLITTLVALSLATSAAMYALLKSVSLVVLPLSVTKSICKTVLMVAVMTLTVIGGGGDTEEGGEKEEEEETEGGGEKDEDEDVVAVTDSE